jgi:hypothetical protein
MTVTSFAELCDRYPGTDKDGTGDHALHTYGSTYEALLGPRRDRVRNVLEVGVRDGCSLKVWRDYFPDAEIFGIDNGKEKGVWAPDCDRINVYYADSFKPETLYAVGRRFGPFDLIVDDGCHLIEAQIATFAALKPFVAADGVYVVEDLEGITHAEKFVSLFGGKIHDRRKVKNRHDDILVVFDFGGD